MAAVCFRLPCIQVGLHVCNMAQVSLAFNVWSSFGYLCQWSGYGIMICYSLMWLSPLWWRCESSAVLRAILERRRNLDFVFSCIMVSWFDDVWAQRCWGQSWSRQIIWNCSLHECGSHGCGGSDFVHGFWHVCQALRLQSSRLNGFFFIVWNSSSRRPHTWYVVANVSQGEA